MLVLRISTVFPLFPIHYLNLGNLENTIDKKAFQRTADKKKNYKSFPQFVGTIWPDILT